MNPQTIIVLGRSGSGKGTQIELIKQRLQGPYLDVVTGDLFRSLEKTETFAGKKIRRIVDSGGLPEDWLAEFLWLRELIEKVVGGEHIIFDGSPRRLEEAKILDKVMAWLERPEIKVILVDISEDEAVSRLLKRARVDDSEAGIRSRLAWFNKEVGPVIDHYEELGSLTRINGLGTVEEIFERIRTALKLE